MSRNRKRNKKGEPKALQKKTPESPDVKVSEATNTLKEEILADVRALASGKLRSVYGLVEKGKELIELESGAWEDSEGGPIKATQKTPDSPELTANDF